jgi:dihydrofolate reductase
LNVVVTRRADLVVPEGVVVAASLDAALVAATGAPTVETAFVVGGAEIYRESFARDDLRWIYLTRVDGNYQCDVTIPDLDRDFERDVWDGEQQLEDAGVRYRIERLKRRPRT